MMNGPIRSSFLYLMNLAYKSRLHIPFLLTVCFLVFDIRFQIEVNINMPRYRTHERLGIEPNNIVEPDISSEEETETESDNDDDDDDDDDFDEHELDVDAENLILNESERPRCRCRRYSHPHDI